MSGSVLLTFNPGSSTIKLGLFVVKDGSPNRLGTGSIDLQRDPLSLHIVKGPKVTDIPMKAMATEDLREVTDEVLGWLASHFSLNDIAVVGHRVVHGGDRFTGPARLSIEALAAIEALVPLAPMHQPQSIRLIKAISHLRPNLPQVASFDTAFHRTQTDLVRRFALPRVLFDQGVKRYGFHGLSYKFIAGQMARVAPNIARGRVVAAHLGSGASLCALQDGISRDTSMAFSTIDGVPMATRCGALDPGVVIHLVKELKWPIEKVEDTLYHHSGLLGISGISADTRDLLESPAPEAREAIDLFAFRISREIAALANTLGGLEGIVFTAGIGEHQPEVREAICNYLGWLGVTVADRANSKNALRIDDGGNVAVLVIATDEEQVIAEEAWSMFNSGAQA